MIKLVLHHKKPGSKTVVLEFRSVNNVVNAPANTGSDNNNNKNAVIKIYYNRPHKHATVIRAIVIHT